MPDEAAPSTLDSVLDPADARLLARLGRKVTESTQERNDAIRRIHAAGGGLREIARAVGLTHPSVLNIVRPRKSRGKAQ